MRFGYMSFMAGFTIAAAFMPVHAEDMKTLLEAHTPGRTRLLATYEKTGGVPFVPDKPRVTLQELTEGSVYVPVHEISWPGVYFEGRFAGQGVNTKIHDPDNIYLLSVDNAPPVRLERPDQLTYEIRNLSDGEHTIRLEKITESPAELPQGVIQHAFNGTSLTQEFEMAPGTYRVYVDGAEMPVTFTAKADGKPRLRLTGLQDGPHMLELMPVAGTILEAGKFKGFYVAAPQQRRPVQPRTRQIEFIGDSDMVAYGAHSSVNEPCTKAQIWETTDTSAGYVTRIARHYDADYQVNAASGIGVVRNWNGERAGLSMPILYPRSIFGGTEAWPRAGWAPQVIVIAIGGNDFSTDLHPGEKWADPAALHADWVRSFVSFVRGIRSQNPGAHIVLGIYATNPAAYLTANEEAYKILSAEDARLSRILYPQTENTACHSHHSQADYDLLSRLVIAHVDAIPDVWARP